LRTLPYHVDNIFIAFTFFNILYSFLAEPLSRGIFPEQWEALTRRHKTDWKIRIVSLAHCSMVGPASLYVLIQQHRERASRSLTERMYEYYEDENLVVDVALAYFLWHFGMMIREYKTHGIQMVLHGAVGVVQLGAAYVSSYSVFPNSA